MQPKKKGYQTSEFWLSLAAVVLGALMSSGIVEAGTVWDKAIGLGITVLAALGYSSSRAKVKASEAGASAALSVAKIKRGNP